MMRSTDNILVRMVRPLVTLENIWVMTVIVARELDDQTVNKRIYIEYRPKYLTSCTIKWWEENSVSKCRR